MPQVAEIRLSNIFLFRLRRFRVPKLMKQVLVLTLQILFSSHQHRRLLIYFISFFFVLEDLALDQVDRLKSSGSLLGQTFWYCGCGL